MKTKSLSLLLVFVLSIAMCKDKISLLQVIVDKGMKDGQKIIFRGESNQVN